MYYEQHRLGQTFPAVSEPPLGAALWSEIGKAIQQIVAAGKTIGSTAKDGNVEQLLDWGARLLLTNPQGYVANGLCGFQQGVAAKAR